MDDMQKVVLLRDPVDGAPIYPETLSRQVVFSDNIDLDEKMGQVNDSIALIDTKITWQKIGEVTGSNSVAINSSNYREFMVYQIYGTAILSTYIVSDKLESSDQSFHICGYYMSSNNCLSATVKASKTSITNYYFYKDGNIITSSATMTVYAR